jgi:XTP/dITP diphosphohydrolase
MKLYFATQNQHKLSEVRKKLPEFISLFDLSEFNLTHEIPETGTTLEENALIKAKFIYDKFNVNCFADDSGLEVESLGNAPGVYSARYAGIPKDDEKNMDKLLFELENKSNRNAQFRTVICFILSGKEYLFEGIIKGKIINERKGKDGFGYDPIFVPDGFEKTFAEMTIEEKNKISHRALAVEKLVEFLNKA